MTLTEHSSSEATSASSFSETRAFGLLPSPKVVVDQDPTQRPTDPYPQALPWVIEFRIVGTTDILYTQVRDTLLIGRADFERGIKPEIDLSVHNGGSLGVSRRHAMITRQDQTLMLQDLNSTNGTRLNETQLKPFEAQRLRPNDIVSLGGLQLQVQYSVVPTELTKKPDTAPLTYDATIPSVGRGQRVLVIEDDDSMGDVFRRALEIAGFKVTLVRTVMQGLGMCFHQMPEAIVINVMVPDMNALDLVRYVRKTEKMRRIPVVVVSATNGGFYKGQALQAGADEFLGKPIAVEDMVKAIGKAVV